MFPASELRVASDGPATLFDIWRSDNVGEDVFLPLVVEELLDYAVRLWDRNNDGDLIVGGCP